MAAIDLDDVLLSLGQAMQSAKALNGKDVDDTDSIQTRRQEVAAVTRELLHLSDRLAALSAVVKSEYWTAKGQDPLL